MEADAPSERQVWKSLFVSLAEQRLQLGSAAFLRTHIPLTLESAQGPVSEEVLLHSLLDTSDVPHSNRVWFVSGGPGAGKSELLEWLVLSIAQHRPQRYRYLLHLRQHEADLLQIATRIRALLPGNASRYEQQVRWKEVASKPRTIAKILLLTALDQLLSSDEESYGLYYALANLVDEQLLQFINACGDGRQQQGTFHLFSAQAWALFREQTVQPVPFSYEAFHQALQSAFQSYLFTGLSLPALLGGVSAALQTQQIRPILLVDDLISSLHLFAPDVLSKLLATPGSWDVVCCVTPQDLNQRTAHLLDQLSELAGVQGTYRIAPLDEPHCIYLAWVYLLAYRQTEGIAGEGLFPFDKQMLVRLLHDLPDHRRTPRAFLQHVKLLLEQKRAGAFLPLGTAGRSEVLPVRGFQWLGKREETNMITLAQLRKGAASLLQETLAPEMLGVPEGTSHSFLHWRKPYKGVSPPILLGGEWRSSDADGILLDDSAPDIAFDLAQFGLATGPLRHQLAVFLRHAPPLLPFFDAALQYRQRKQQELERQLGMSLDFFALTLALWSLQLGGQSVPPSLAAMGQQLHVLATSPAQTVSRRSDSLAEWRQFFLDGFSLEEGGIDTEKLQRLDMGMETVEQQCQHLLTLEATTIGKAFRWRGRSLQAALETWQRLLPTS